MLWRPPLLACCALLAACHTYPTLGDPCADAGEVSCGSLSTNDALLLRCVGGAYDSVGTCPTGVCSPAQSGDHLFCDQVPYAVQGTPCSGRLPVACAAGQRAVLRCGAHDWVLASRCEPDAACARGGDAGYTCLQR